MMIKLGIHHIPSAITLTALGLGSCAALLFLQAGPAVALAPLLILIAAALDFCDGFVARKLNATSDFGKELDSLSDLVCFGVVPALAISAPFSGTVFWFIAVISIFYILCAAVRLAHFNSIPASESFSGMPSPAAALFVISACQLHYSLGLLTAIIAAILMVSPLMHPSPKGALSKQPLILLLIAAVGIGLFAVGFLWLGIFMALLGYVGTAIRDYLND